MKGHLDDLSRENIRLSKVFEEVKSRNDDLSSRQKDMINQAFTYIMMEVWGVDLRLVVPRVERRADKLAIMKAIEDKRGTGVS